ncbi:MAG: hypothetical protein U9R42_11590 [Bacteroidota bacterium]|nr:hypothetical protein [Bacteroidota bacterium]
MKKIILLSLLIGIFGSLYSKDISIKINNENEFDVQLFVGTIAFEDNEYSNDNIVKQRKKLNIESSGRRPIKKGRSKNVSLRELNRNDVIIVFGLFEGGGRTEVYRYLVKDVSDVIYITFKTVKLYRPRGSYYPFVNRLKKTNDIDSTTSITNTEITGCFVFYNVSKFNKDEVHIFRPTIKTDIEKTSHSIEPITIPIKKNASLPFLCGNKLVNRLPEETDVTCREVKFTGYEKIVENFGENPLQFITLNFINSQQLVVKHKGSTYLDLFNSCEKSDKDKIMNKFKKCIDERNNYSFHLYYISSIHLIDSITLIEQTIKKIKEEELLIDNDIVSKKGCFRATGKTKVLLSEANHVKDIMSIDITPILYFNVAKQGSFKPTYYEASNYLEIYRKIGAFIELPALDEEIRIISDPANTIEKLKELFNDPKIFETISKRICSGIADPLPLNVISAASDKLGE